MVYVTHMQPRSMKWTRLCQLKQVPQTVGACDHLSKLGGEYASILITAVSWFHFSSPHSYGVLPPVFTVRRHSFLCTAAAQVGEVSRIIQRSQIISPGHWPNSAKNP